MRAVWVDHGNGSLDIKLVINVGARFAGSDVSKALAGSGSDPRLAVSTMMVSPGMDDASKN